MKTFSFTALLIALTGGQVHAEDLAPYLAFHAGYALGVDVDVSNSVVTDLDTRSGGAFSGAAGIDYGDVRGEIELNYISQDISAVEALDQRFNLGGDFDSLSLLFNTYYAPSFGDVEPYIGGGVGVTRYDIESDILNLNESDEVFTWQGRIGVAFNITNHCALDFNYTYQDGEDISIQDANIDQQQSIVKAGVRYTF